jgi:hypothetical protein
MAEEHSGTAGGFHIGNVRGNVQVKAGGDVVAGDKTTTTITALQKGFAGPREKEQFQSQLEQLLEALRGLKTQIEQHPALSQEDKESAAGEILEHVTKLKAVKAKTADMAVGTPPSPDVASTVEKTLDRAGGVIEKVQGLAKKASGIGQTIADFAATYGPLLAGARHLFGLP